MTHSAASQSASARLALTLTRKLQIVFGLALVVLLALGGYLLLNVRLNANALFVVQQEVEGELVPLHQLLSLTTAAAHAVHPDTSNPAEFESARRSALILLEQMRASPLDQADERIALAALESAWAVLEQQALMAPGDKDLTEIERAVRSAETAGLQFDTAALTEVSEASRVVKQTAGRGLIVAVAGLVVALSSLIGLGAGVQRWMLDPLARLRASMDRFRQGEYEQRLPIQTHDEMGDIASTFNRLADDLQRAIGRLTALHEAATAIGAIRNVDRLLDHVIQVLREAFQYDHPAIALLDERGEDLILRAAWGYELLVGAPLPPGRGIARRVMQSGQPIIVSDVRLEANYLPGIAGARSNLAVSIRGEGRAIGVINLESRQPGAYGEQDAALLSALAELVAVALENSRLYSRLAELATTDPLTGLANRRVLFDRLGQELERGQRFNHAVSLLMVDVDDFKRYNDTHGHPAGDELLRSLASLLRVTLRQVDLAARYGGEEFAAILPHAGAAEGQQIAERLRAEAEAAWESSGVTLSIGVATAPEHGQTTESLLDAADRALYSAKAAGKNCIRVCDRRSS